MDKLNEIGILARGALSALSGAKKLAKKTDGGDLGKTTSPKPDRREYFKQYNANRTPAQKEADRVQRRNRYATDPEVRQKQIDYSAERMKDPAIRAAKKQYDADRYRATVDRYQSYMDNPDTFKPETLPTKDIMRFKDFLNRKMGSK